MRILGIDPGIGRCGWGVVEENKGKFTALAYDCLETHKDTLVEKRLEAVHKEIARIIKKYNPDVMSIEELYFGSNAKTAFVVGQARGVILLAASENKVPISIYNPMAVKIAVTGYGSAEKNQVGQMVKSILKLKEVPKPDDTADALAVALTHAFSSKLAKISK